MECGICEEKISRYDQRRAILLCGHHVCYACLREHLTVCVDEKKPLVCPEWGCNTPINPRGILPLAVLKDITDEGLAKEAVRYRNALIEYRKSIGDELKRIMQESRTMQCPDIGCTGSAVLSAITEEVDFVDSGAGAGEPDRIEESDGAAVPDRIEESDGVPDGEDSSSVQSSKKVLQCDTCNRLICDRCWEFEHEGNCNKTTIQDLSIIAKITKPCPICLTPIQKNKGCDHMFCIRCKTHFSWKTGEVWNTGMHASRVPILDKRGIPKKPTRQSLPVSTPTVTDDRNNCMECMQECDMLQVLGRCCSCSSFPLCSKCSRE